MIYRLFIGVIPVLLFSYTAQVLFKIGAESISNFDLRNIVSHPLSFIGMILSSWQLMLGFVLAGIGALIYIFLLSKYDLTLVFPILGAMGFILLPIIGKLVLQEDVSGGRFLGTIIVAIGMLIVVRN